MTPLADLLNTLVAVWRKSYVDDGGGGQEVTLALVATLPARLSQPSNADREVGDQSGAELTHIVYLAPGANVRRDDELRVGGRVLDVHATFEPSVSGIYLRADCKARQPEFVP